MLETRLDELERRFAAAEAELKKGAPEKPAVK